MAWTIQGNQNSDVGEVTFICDEPDSPLQSILFTNYRHTRPAFIFTFRSEEERDNFNKQLGDRGWTLPDNKLLIDNRRYSPTAPDDSSDEDETDFLSVLWSTSPSLAQNQPLKSMIINMVNAPYSSEEKSFESIIEQWRKLIMEGNFEACFYPIANLNAPLGLLFSESAKINQGEAKKQLEAMALKAYLLVDSYEKGFDEAKKFIFEQYTKGNLTTADLIQYKNSKSDRRNMLKKYQLYYDVAVAIGQKDLNEAFQLLNSITSYEELPEKEKKYPYHHSFEEFKKAYNELYQRAQQQLCYHIYFSAKAKEESLEALGSLDDEDRDADFDIYSQAIEKGLLGKDDDLVRSIYTAQVRKYDDPSSSSLQALNQQNQGMLESLEAPCSNYNIQSLVELTKKTIALRKVIADNERQAADEIQALKAELQALKKELKSSGGQQATSSSSSAKQNTFFASPSGQESPENYSVPKKE